MNNMHSNNKKELVTFEGQNDNNQTPQYKKVLADMRQQLFPLPAVQPGKEDSNLTSAVQKALRTLGEMKTSNGTKTSLKATTPLIPDKGIKEKVPDNPTTVDNAIQMLASCLDGMPNFGDPSVVKNIDPLTTIPALIAHIYCDSQLPNVIDNAYGGKVADKEVAAVAMVSDMIGYDPEQSAGVFVNGGTACNFYGVKMALNKILPELRKKGFQGSLEELNKHEKTHTNRTVRIVAAENSHYSTDTLVDWLGLGTDNIVKIPNNTDNSMKIDELEQKCREILDKGDVLACVIATMGTTDSMGMDDLEDIHNMVQKLKNDYNLNYTPHIHADSVIGWAWSVFNDYDFDKNPLGFNSELLENLNSIKSKIAKLKYADSIGADFHKAGFTPLISSAVIAKDKKDLYRLGRDPNQIPYLFHEEGDVYDPGVFTFETSRSGAGQLAAWINLKTLGKNGYRTLIAHNMQCAQDLRHLFEDDPGIKTLNTMNHGFVTLFRVYPKGMSKEDAYKAETSNGPEAKALLEKVNIYNKKVFHYIEKMNNFDMSMTGAYCKTPQGDPVVALKHYIMSPFTEMEHLKAFYEEVVRAQNAVDEKDTTDEAGTSI